MKKVFIVIIICNCLFSCNKKTQNYVQSSKVSLLQEIPRDLTLNTFFDDFDYISLETTEESLFSTVNKLIVDDNKYYILDKANRKKVFIFADDGTFIRTIGRVGKGPGEYSNIEDFTIDENSKNIIIFLSPFLGLDST